MDSRGFDFGGLFVALVIVGAVLGVLVCVGAHFLSGHLTLGWQ